MSELARKAAASKMVRAIGIEAVHKQACMYTLIQDEEQLMADFACRQASLAGRQRFPISDGPAIFGLSLIRPRVWPSEAGAHAHDVTGGAAPVVTVSSAPPHPPTMSF